MNKPKIERLSRKIERPQRPPRGMQWPKFDTFFTPAEDPLDGLDETDDLEANAVNIMGQVEKVFIEDEQRRLDEYRAVIDPGFYLVVCFQSRAQKEEFLTKAGMSDLGDDYLDGLKVAKRMGLDVPPIALPAKAGKKIPRPLRDVQIIKRGGEK